MTGYTHALAGGAAVWLLAPFAAPGDLGLLVALGAACALLPDLDTRGSLAQGTAVAKLAGMAVRATTRHRGWTHSLAAWAAFTALSAYPVLVSARLPWTALSAASLGYLSHLLLDAMTVRGVPLLWPDPSPRHILLSRWRVTTGSAAEWALFFLLAFSLAPLLLLFGGPFAAASGGANLSL